MEQVLVYGTGAFFTEYKNELLKIYDIDGYIDRNGEYGGRKIYSSPKEITNICDKKVIIMLTNVRYCYEVVESLLEAGVLHNNIIFGIAMWGDFSKYTSITVSEDGKIVLNKNGISVRTSCEDEFYNVTEVLLLDAYKHYINTDKKEVVIDIGMNIGDSTLFFLNDDKVEKVYGYEPFKKTYKDAERNLKEFLQSDRLCINNYGLSDQDRILHLTINSKMSCGQSTNEMANDIAIDNYEEWGFLTRKENTMETIEVKKSSAVLKEIFKKHEQREIVLKMDCEGEEYAILDDLDKADLLSKISLVMLEWHYKGDNIVLELLRKNGFSYTTMGKNLHQYIGLIYAWKM